MVYEFIVQQFLLNWQFTRSETYELLNSLNDEQLQYKPKGEKWQPLSVQFMCIGRSQIVNTEAILTGKKDHGLYNSPHVPNKDTYKTQKDLLAFLRSTDEKWVKAIKQKQTDEDFFIQYPEYKVILPSQISRLAQHERLHHGQMISYFTLAEFSLPEDFKRGWAL